MKIEDELQKFYEEEVNGVRVPTCPAATRSSAEPAHSGRLFRFAFAALIVIAFIPLGYRASKPSALAVRAASVCRTYELDVRISAGLLDLHKSLSESIFSGGKK